MADHQTARPMPSATTHVLAIDQGTTSSRAILFDREGNPTAIAQRELTQHYPQPGWVEHDPQEIWDITLAVAREVLTQSHVAPSTVACAGLANQRETTIVWEAASGRPVCPAIVWQDRRTAPLCRQLADDGLAPLFSERTGLCLDPYFSGVKLAWILDHVEGVRRAAEAGRLRFGTVDSWLLWNLTGGQVHATDPGNASRTLLFNLHTLRWDEELLSILRIPASLLPEIRPSGGLFGACHERLFGHSIPITGVAGDQQAALFGQACFEPGQAKNTYGTGCFLLLQTGPQPVFSGRQLLTTVAWQIGGQTSYALEGSVFAAGSTIQWLRDGLGLFPNAPDCDRLAGGVPDSGGVFLVPAFAGLGAPYWDAQARGLLIGLTRGTRPAHLCRAALEAIACQTAEVLEAMEADSGLRLAALQVDGGAARSDILMQIQADLLGVPVRRPPLLETTAFGAAALAGLAAGFYPDHSIVERRATGGQSFLPSRPPAEASAFLQQWKRAVSRSRHWAVD